MKLLTIITFLVATVSCPILAQKYIQQKVDYEINATLLDPQKELQADFNIAYHNQSNDELDHLIFHLWPNAYRSRTSEFAKQKTDHGDRKFYFAEEDDRGGYKEISFEVDGQPLEVSKVDGHEDVVRLDLPEALVPGEKLVINGSFLLDIPRTFSRLGRTERSVQLTQWFPKPAVYDIEGWHPMPYLDIGEFYSEFGDYKVTITCPSDYIVAGTGLLQEIDEKERYLALARDKIPYKHPDTVKTLTFKARKVHDFALFLDKDFVISHDLANFENNGQPVECWSFYHEDQKAWSRSIQYVKRSVEFGSEKIGKYPYPQVTAVQGAIAAGGGMEYPMVTIIDPINNERALDEVIAHEVFHNWFYGILATNERDHPWLDEGFTSYYEKRYMRKYYPEDSGPLPESLGLGDVEEALYYFQASRGKEMTHCCASRHYHPVNYQVAAYTKPRLALTYLEDLYGQSVLDRVVQAYYRDWAFRHPGPLDVRQHFEEEYGMDMLWLFEDILQDNKVLDYAIDGFEKHSGHVRVRNDGEIAAPYRITGLSGPDTFFTTVATGHGVKRTFQQDLSEVDEVILDPHNASPDLERRDNRSVVKRPWLSRQKTRVHVFPGVQRGHHTLYVYPVMGWNNYDRYMLGLQIANRAIQPRKFNFTLNPMYGFGSKAPVGFGDVHYNFFRRQGKVRYAQVGIRYKRYSTSEEDAYGHLYYSKLSPYVTLNLRGNETTYESSKVSLWGHVITNRYGPLIDITNTNVDREYKVLGATYRWQRKGGIHPQSFEAELEYGDYGIEGTNLFDESYLRLTAEYDINLYYREDKKIDVRFFGGFFPHHSRDETGSFDPLFNPRTLGMAYEGYNDLYDHTFFGRNESEGWMAHQVAMEEGGFKTALTSSYAGVYGNSNKGLLALNLEADLPFDLPVLNAIKPYFDMGYFAESSRSADLDLADQIMWSGGVTFRLLDDIFEIHFPLVNSDNIVEGFEAGDQHTVWRRATFTLNLKKLNLYKIVEDAELKLP